MNDRDERVRRFSVLALGRIGKPAEKHLVTALQHKDLKIRVLAARHLSSYDDLASDALAALIRAARDKSQRVRMTAVRSLVRLPLGLRCSQGVLDALATALTDSNERVRHDAAYGMQSFKSHVAPAVPTIAKALRHKDAKVRLWAGIVLTSLGPDAKAALPELIQNAIRDKGNPRNRSRDALSKIGPDANSALLALLKDGIERERVGAADVLGYNHPEDERVLPALVEALRDTSSRVRAAAATALGAFAADALEATGALTKALNDGDQATRLAAGNALQQINEAAGRSGPAKETEPPKPISRIDIKPLHRLNPNDGVLRCADFTPDGRRIAAGGGRMVTLLVVQTGEVVRRFTNHRSTVTALDISSDGKWLATCGKDRTVRLWDMNTGMQLKSFSTGIPASCWSVAFSHDNRKLAASSTAMIYLWDRVSGKLDDSFYAEGQMAFTHICFSPDGSRLAAGGNVGTSVVFDVVGFREPKQRSLRQRFQFHNWDRKSVAFVGFSPDSKWLVSVGDDQAARLWDADKGGAWLKLRIAGKGQGVAFSRDGSKIIALAEDESLHVLGAKGKLLGTAKGTDKSVRSLAISPDGTTLATFGEDRVIKIWDVNRIAGGADKVTAFKPRVVTDLQRASTLVKKFDKNRDGGLDVHEVLASPGSASAVAIWFPYDSDQNGRLTPAEMARCFSGEAKQRAAEGTKR